MKKPNRKSVVIGILFAILIAAFTLRITNINNVPAGIFPDEAQNGVDAQEANATGQYKLFYESNNGREGLFINLQALTIKYIGNTVLGLKLWSIIFGTLTVLGIFFLAAELFQNQLAGLVGAYLTAFSYWAINFSRIGFRAIMVPFILTWAFYFLFKGLRTKKLHDFILAGFIYGLGLHTYIAFRTSPLVLVVLLLSLIITRKSFLREYWKAILVFAIAMFVASGPMLLDFFVWNPQHYTSRTGSISVLNSEVNKGDLLGAMSKTFALSLAKYNFWGDQNFRQNYAPYPILNPITGLAFLGGFLYCIFKFFQLAWLRFKKGVRSEKLDIYVFLLTWFFALLIPEFLAYEGNPHALRSIGTIPVVMIFAVIPFIWIFQKYHAFGHAFKTFTISILTIAFIFIAVFDTTKYFVYFANSPQQHGAFQANLKLVSDYIRVVPQTSEKYIVTGSMERLTIKYLNPTLPNTFYFYPGQINEISPSDLNNTVFIFTSQDWDAINGIRNRIPNLVYEEYRNKFGDVFYTLKRN